MSALPVQLTHFDPARTKKMIRRLRKRLAEVIYPGRLPKRAVRRAKARRRGTARRAASISRPQLHAATVAHVDAMAFFEKRRPTYERLARAVSPYVDPHGTVLDIGANVGYFSLILSEITEFRGTAHLYEPIPHLAGLCAHTLANAPFDPVVHVYGLSDRDGKASIFLAADGNLGWNTLVAEKANGMSELQIELRRFDGSRLPSPPCFVKIDVEGAEHLVLAGLLPAIRVWGPDRPVILCEVGWGQAHPAWAAELEVFDRLLALGYEARSLDGEPVDLGSLRRTTDVLFVPLP